MQQKLPNKTYTIIFKLGHLIMKKTSFISALSISILSISMAVAAPADAVNQIRQNATQVLSILKKR